MKKKSPVKRRRLVPSVKSLIRADPPIGRVVEEHHPESCVCEPCCTFRRKRWLERREAEQRREADANSGFWIAAFILTVVAAVMVGAYYFFAAPSY